MAASEGVPAVEDRSAAALGAVYQLVSRLFEEPDRETYRALASGEVATEMSTLLDAAGLAGERRVPPFRPEDEYDLLCARFNDLFAVGYPDPPVPLYESAYCEDHRWEGINVDLARAYEHFGLEIDDSRREHHDHLVLELEFAGYLARLAALEGGESPRLARRDFLDRHLVPFAEDLADAIGGEVGTGMYDDVVGFLEELVRRDLTELESWSDGSDRERGPR